MSDDEIQKKTPEEHLADARRAVPPSGALTRRRWIVGDRGWYLISVGALFVVMALPLLGITEQQPGIRQKFGLPLSIAGAAGLSDQQALFAWGTLWALSGLSAIIAGAWPGQHDAWGFISLWTFSAVWGTLNLYGGTALDYRQEAYSGTVYLLIAASILIVSGMTESPTAYNHSRRHRRGRTG